MADFFIVLLKEIVNYIIYWSPSVVGVLVGGFFVQRYWVRKANESALIEYLTKELNDLVDETLEYWSLDCSGATKRAIENRLQARMMEQKIKGAIKNVSAVCDAYSERYCSRFGSVLLRSNRRVDFAKLMVEVNEACTGGSFEVEKRPADRSRFLTIVNATHRVRWELIQRRI